MASLTNTKIKNTYVSLLKVADNGQLDGTLQDITDGAGNTSGVQLNTGGDLTASGTVAFGSLKDSGENITITKFVDAADGIGSNNNDTTIPTSAAVSAYVASQVTLEDLDFAGDSGTGAVDLDSQTLSIVGTANEITTAAGAQTLTIGLPSTINVNVQGDLTGNVTATSILQDGVTATTQLTSDNSTKVATTAFVKSVVTAENLDIAGTSGTGSVDLDSQALTIAGTTNEIETVASGQTITVGLPSDVIIGNDLTVTTDASVGNNLDVTGALGVDGNFDVNTNKFTVQSATGNTAVAGTFGVTGNTTLSTVDATGLASLDGGIDVDGAFTVADTTGNVSTSGTLAVTGTTTLTDDLAVDTDTLFVDASADRVGINKNNPAVALDVVGDITSSATITGVTLAGTLSTAAQTNITSVGTLSSLAVSGNLTVDTNTLFVDAANNRVGIGTSSPTPNADTTYNHIQIGQSAVILGYNSGASLLAVGENFYWDGVWKRLTSAPASAHLMNTGTHDFRVTASSTADSAITWISALNIDNSGNVGIGGTPTHKLYVRNDVSASTDLDPTTIKLYNNNDGGSAIEFSNGVSGNSKISLGVESTGAGSDDTYIGFSTSANAATASEKMRIDSSGNLLVGLTSGGKFSVSYGGNDTHFGLGGNYDNYITAGSGGTTIFRNGATERMRITSGGEVLFGNNGSLGRIFDNGTDRLSLETEGAEINFGSGSVLHSFMSANTGVAFSVFTTYDDLTDLGRVNARFDDIYATNATIQTSDANEKQQIEDLDDAELRVATQIKGLIKKFKWNKAVDRKGDDARIHIGVIAQDVKAAFEAEGLDADRYGLFISSTWTDEETGQEKTRLGVRYSELLAFIIAAL